MTGSPRPFLALDTTTPLGGVALVGADGGLLSEYAADVRGSHAPRLMMAVERLLSEAGIDPAQLAGIGVSIGPGSFTGLRVGVATALGLARAADIPLFPVPTLEALAWGAPRGDGGVAVAMSSRKGELYGAVYHFEGSDWPNKHLLVPRAVSPEQFAADLANLGSTVTLVGTAADDLPGLVDLAWVWRGPTLFDRPRAAVIGWRAAQMAAAGEHYPADQVVPRYLKASQAEITWNQRHGRPGD